MTNFAVNNIFFCYMFFGDTVQIAFDIARRYSARGRQTTVRWQKQVFIHTRLSRAYLALARLSCNDKLPVMQNVNVRVAYVFSRPYTQYGRAYATGLRLSSSSVVCTEYVVDKRCVLDQKLLLTAYRKSYRPYEKSIGTKMNELDLCLDVFQGHVNHCGVNISKST